MRQTEQRNRMMAALAAMFIAVGRAMAQNHEEAAGILLIISPPPFVLFLEFVSCH